MSVAGNKALRFYRQMNIYFNNITILRAERSPWSFILILDCQRTECKCNTTSFAIDFSSFCHSKHEYDSYIYLSYDRFDNYIFESVVWFHACHVLVQYTDLLFCVPTRGTARIKKIGYGWNTDSVSRYLVKVTVFLTKIYVGKGGI